MSALLPSPLSNPCIYSRCWLCRAHDTSLFPVVPRPNTGLKYNGGQGVAPPSTTAAAGSLRLGCCASPMQCDEGARCSAPDQDVDCYTMSVNRSPGDTRETCLDSQDPIWSCGPRCISPKHLDTYRWDDPAMGMSDRGLRSGSDAVSGTWSNLDFVNRSPGAARGPCMDSPGLNLILWLPMQPRNTERLLQDAITWRLTDRMSVMPPRNCAEILPSLRGRACAV